MVQGATGGRALGLGRLGVQLLHLHVAHPCWHYVQTWVCLLTWVLPEKAESTPFLLSEVTRGQGPLGKAEGQVYSEAIA